MLAARISHDDPGLWFTRVHALPNFPHINIGLKPTCQYHLPIPRSPTLSLSLKVLSKPRLPCRTPFQHFLLPLPMIAWTIKRPPPGFQPPPPFPATFPVPIWMGIPTVRSSEVISHWSVTLFLPVNGQDSDPFSSALFGRVGRLPARPRSPRP